METKKYELTNESITLDNGTKLYHIRALRDFGNVKAGEIGGYVQGENNLSQEGDAWVYGDARVSGDAEVKTNDDLCVFTYFGSKNRPTTAFKTKDGGINVKCGCFQGTLQQFREKVKETHGTNDYAVEYLMIADLIEHRLVGRNKKE